jgi:hypothetical protein
VSRRYPELVIAGEVVLVVSVRPAVKLATLATRASRLPIGLGYHDAGTWAVFDVELDEPALERVLAIVRAHTGTDS